MEHTIAHEEHAGGGVKEIVKVTIILSVLTIIELALGFWMIGMPLVSTLRFTVKGVIIILMLAKAFYIVAYFMHLKHEIRNLIMTIVVPLCLFVWFITAFLYDGNSFRHLRNTYDRHFKEQSTIKVAPKEEAKPAEHHAE
ncbi:MAG TPA: cytochrome C oxidase subunit IV family protein [Sediminibacterium sp.]|nr:cytochrome C oxidase subunit IV family protein [Sediminibacterium sp.]